MASCAPSNSMKGGQGEVKQAVQGPGANAKVASESAGTTSLWPHPHKTPASPEAGLRKIETFPSEGYVRRSSVLLKNMM